MEQTRQETFLLSLSSVVIINTAACNNLFLSAAQGQFDNNAVQVRPITKREEIPFPLVGFHCQPMQGKQGVNVENQQDFLKRFLSPSVVAQVLRWW